MRHKDKPGLKTFVDLCMVEYVLSSCNFPFRNQPIYSMITHPAAGNLPIKALVARQWPTSLFAVFHLSSALN